MTDQIPHIDAEGLLCPMPLMLLKQKLATLPAGAQVHIAVTDEHAELDFVTWCERFGHQLELLSSESGLWHFSVTKA